MTRRDKGRTRPWLVLGCLTAVAAGTNATAPRPASTGERLTREAAVADVGQLVDFLELTHPDPYGREGKLAVHRRLHQMLQGIPEDGVEVTELHSLLQPFLISLEDAHTRVQPLRSVTEEGGSGLAVDLRILALTESEPVPALFIQGASGHPGLAGSRLEAVEGVQMAELIRRSQLWDGYENEFGRLHNLVQRLHGLKGLRELLPEWESGRSVRLSITRPDGKSEQVVVPLGQPPSTWEGEGVETALELPVTRAGVAAYRFIGQDRSTVLLRLDNTWAYRETFESLTKLGEGNRSWAESFYRQYYGKEPPADTAALVESVPAATEILGKLVEEMDAARTRRLVVDLRRNSGGTSQLVDMLLYYLYGREAWAEFFGNFHTVRRLTPDDLAGLAAETATRFPGRVGDYDFSELRETTPGSEEYWRHTTVSFARELEYSEHEGYYVPPEVVVVVAPRTYSGGFWIAAALHRMGARLVGVPSAQAGNAYGHVKYITLSNSGIQVGVSSRRFLLFPEDPSGMTVLPVDIPLTEACWRETGYDPNASMLLALPAANDDSGTGERIRR